MDSSVGAVVEALEKKNMLRDSIIVFTTDNGGPAEGFNLNAASNWPLRGVKDTYFEGTYQREWLFYLCASTPSIYKLPERLLSNVGPSYWIKQKLRSVWSA